MKHLIVLLALIAAPLEADAQNSQGPDLASIVKAANLRVWVGVGLGGSSFGFSSSADLTVAKGSIAGGFMRFATASGLPGAGIGGLPSAKRDMSGLRLGMLKTTEAYTGGIYLGLGKLSGIIPDEEYCNYYDGLPEEQRRPNTLFGCTRGLKTTAIAVMAEFMRHSRFRGVSLKPFLIYGNSEFWPGMTVQLVVGKLR